jgi:CBS-domain-containing membrane protein
MTVNALWILAFCLVTAAGAAALKWARSNSKSFRPVGLAVLYVSSLAFFGIWCVNFSAGRMASALSSYIPPSAAVAASKALANNQVPRTFYFFFMYVAVLSIGLLLVQPDQAEDGLDES